MLQFPSVHFPSLFDDDVVSYRHFTASPFLPSALWFSISCFSPRDEKSSRDPSRTRFLSHEYPFFLKLPPITSVRNKKKRRCWCDECLFNQWRNFLRRDETWRYVDIPQETTSFLLTKRKPHREPWMLSILSIKMFIYIRKICPFSIRDSLDSIRDSPFFSK